MAYPFQSRGRRKGKTAPKRRKNAVTIKDRRAYLRREVARPPYVVEGEQFSSESKAKVEARFRSHDDSRRVQVEDSLGTVLAVYYRGKEMSPVDWMPNPKPEPGDSLYVPNMPFHHFKRLVQDLLGVPASWDHRMIDSDWRLGSTPEMTADSLRVVVDAQRSPQSSEQSAMDKMRRGEWKGRKRNSITGKKLIAQWRDSYAEGGYGYIHGDSVPELLKAIKARLEKDPTSLHRFTISRTFGGSKDIGVGEIDARVGTITWTNFSARGDKVIKFKSPGRWGVYLYDDADRYREAKPVKVFDTYQKADQWLMAYEGDLRLSGVPRKVNGRAKGVGIVATRKALKRLSKANPVDVRSNPVRYMVREDDWPLWSGKQWWSVYDITTGEKINFKPGVTGGWRFGSEDKAQKAADKLNKGGVVPRYSNPNGSRDDADELYEGFHGKPSTKTTEVHTRLKSRDRLSELGDLVELRVITPAGKKVRLVQDDRGIWHPINSKQPSYLAANRRTPMLSSSPDRRQLYIEGGIQEADVSAMGLGGDWERDSMLLGILTYATYRTEKGFDKFQLTDYYHKLGEETGDEPVLIYDSINALLSISGGRYEVRNEGIVN